MKNILKTEELLMMIAPLVYLYEMHTGVSWWWYAVLFFAPDLSMVGYLVNTRAGAFLYNLFHHKGLAIAAVLAGFFFHVPYLLVAGLILFSHASFDRVFGYGLKYPDNFKHTHLGMI